MSHSVLLAALFCLMQEEKASVSLAHDVVFNAPSRVRVEALRSPKGDLRKVVMFELDFELSTEITKLDQIEVRVFTKPGSTRIEKLLPYPALVDDIGKLSHLPASENATALELGEGIGLEFSKDRTLVTRKPWRQWVKRSADMDIVSLDYMPTPKNVLVATTEDSAATAVFKLKQNSTDTLAGKREFAVVFDCLQKSMPNNVVIECLAFDVERTVLGYAVSVPALVEGQEMTGQSFSFGLGFRGGLGDPLWALHRQAKDIRDAGCDWIAPVILNRWFATHHVAGNYVLRKTLVAEWPLVLHEDGTFEMSKMGTAGLDARKRGEWSIEIDDDWLTTAPALKLQFTQLPDSNSGWRPIIPPVIQTYYIEHAVGGGTTFIPENARLPMHGRTPIYLNVQPYPKHRGNYDYESRAAVFHHNRIWSYGYQLVRQPATQAE